MKVPENSESEALDADALRAEALEATGPATLTSSVLAARSSSAVSSSAVSSVVGPPSASEGAPSSAAAEPVDLDPLDVEDVLEVEPEPLGEEAVAAAPTNGFQAFLRHANLHNLLQIESMSRTTGVFLVVSGGSRGYLHLADGELVHAETGQASGEAAAAEILAWETGEFKSCARTLAPVRTVHSSVQSLLMRLAQASDEAAHNARRHQSSRVVRRPLDQEAPTETYLPAIPAAPALPSGALLSGALLSGALPLGALPLGATPATPPAGPPGLPAALEAATRGVHPPPTPPPLMPPPSAAGPPSQRPSRSEPTSVADVLLSASGEVIQGRGAATEEFAARVAYATRLADLIGRAIRSGTPKGLELRGKSTQTIVQWQADGTLSASLDLAQPPRR